VFAILEAVVIIALAGLGIADAWRLSGVVRGGGFFPDVIGPDRYLGAVAGGLLVCGLAYLLRQLRRTSHAQAPGKALDVGQTLQVALVSVLLAVYACAFPFLGYLVATMLFFPVTYFVFGVRPWLKSAWVGVFTAVLFYVIFAHFAEIPLPKGFLELVF
jgi:tripartite tricarboxylate transporter TctB family protein